MKKFVQIVASVVVTIILWWIGVDLGQNIRNASDVGLLFAVCSMGSFVIAFCGRGGGGSGDGGK